MLNTLKKKTNLRWSKMTGRVVVVFLYLSSCLFNRGDCCTQGFPNLRTVSQLSRSCDPCVVNSQSGIQTIIPGMNFTCNGTIVKWSVAGEFVQGSQVPPHTSRLQIWRPQPSSDSSYSLAEDISLTNCPTNIMRLERNMNVFECNLLSSGVQVKPGDILGTYLSRTTNNTDMRFSVFFDRNTPQHTISYVLNSDPQTTSPFTGNTATIEALPLVTLEVQDNDVETTMLPQDLTEPEWIPEPEPVTDTPNAGTSKTATFEPVTGADEDSSSTSSNSVVVIGAVIAVLLVVLIAVLLAIALFFGARRTSRKMLTDDRVFENLSYQGPADSQLNHSYAEIGTITRGSVISGHRQATTASAAGSAKGGPRVTPKTHRNLMDFEVMGNPQYTSTLGLYVPTMEQREAMILISQETGSAYYNALGSQQCSSAVSSSPTKFFHETDTFWEPASDSQALYSQLSEHKYREILRHKIKITDMLGSGQFGKVNKGLWQISPDNALECAVKTLHAEATEEDCVAFLQEAAINGQFHHPNVVQLLGVVTVGEPVMIVLELLSNGNLLAYLKNMRPSPGELVETKVSRLLLRFCQQVASGMEYLSRKGFVHRDLAARNILVTEDKICKISDFGMSRDMSGGYYISSGGKIPVKWTAPEALHYKKYSTASDVWSFGALMYEIWSLGHKPFEEYNNYEVIGLVDSGFRLPPPPGCPRLVYQLMIQCWNPVSKQRLSFHSVGERLNVSEVELMASEEELDAGCDSSAMMLGTPLSAAANLYRELQQTYTTSPVVN